MSFLSRFFSSIGLIKRKVTVLIVGLDNSGKSTLVNWLKHDSNDGGDQKIVPTIGFNVDSFHRNKLIYNVFDMSGSEKYRSLWEHYYSDANAVIFVVDASDRMRIGVVKDEMKIMLKHKDLMENIPLLVLANKMDIEGSLSADTCHDELGLSSIRNKSWHICSCSALTGEGLENGLEWLSGLSYSLHFTFSRPLSHP